MRDGSRVVAGPPGPPGELEQLRRLARVWEELLPTPLLGDIFDVGWRAHRHNLAVREGWLGDPRRAQRRSTALLVAVAAAVAGSVVVALWLAFRALALLFGLG